LTGYRQSFRKPWFVAARTTETKATKEGEEIMKKIVAIVLISFLGFLGCSGDDNDTNTIGEAIPVAPWRHVETTTPTYMWTPVPWATKYRLLVEDTNQASTIQDSNENSIIDEWYSAEEAGCSSEDGLCIVTPDIEVYEEHTFKVQACASQECGMWSETLKFEVAPPKGPRFTDNGDGTVTDNNKKLMWSKDANLFGRQYWYDAMDYCEGLMWANHTDWRLPSLAELKSLIDTSEYAPALPLGHPFLNVQPLDHYYWTSTAYPIGWIEEMWYVLMYNGREDHGAQSTGRFVWPVRSGN